MYCVRKVTNDLYWVGANDHRLALFENCFPIPRGVSYNSYCLLDEKTVLFDTVDWSACRQLLENLAYVLDGRELDYLLVNHLEPDHAACIEEILLRHPKVKLISNEKAFMLMRQFGFHVDGHECIEVKEGDTFSFGKHTVTFVGAPMVHWPEAMVTLDVTDGVLFSADAFGTFGALDGKLFADEVDFDTFSKSDFRAVKVKSCEAVKKSKKLLKFVLDDGSGTDRVILSGIHEYYEPEELVGKTCVAITNLPPRPMMGIASEGMLISAVHHEEGAEKLHLLMLDPHIPAGAKLY